MASLAGGVAAQADEVEPTAQALATPTVAVETQPTEVVQTEPTVENASPTPVTLLPTLQVPPTETFRVIEISTRVVTHVPTFVPTEVPTAGEPTIDPAPIATATVDIGLPPVLTFEPTATSVGEIATATIDVLTPRPFSTDIATSTATSTSTSIVTETITTTAIISSTGTPGWLPPGPECNLVESEIAVKLDVPYIHQVLDIGGADGNWACGPTSIAMILAYYGKLDPWQEYMAREAAAGQHTVAPTAVAVTTSGVIASVHTSTPAHTSTTTATSARTVRPARSVTAKVTASMVRRAGLWFGPYVTNAYSNNGYMYNSTAGDPRGDQVAGLYGTISPTGLADWSRMRFVLEQHGLSSRHISVSWDGVVAALDRGHPVVLGADLTAAGHILVVVGYTEGGQLIVNDPYGNRFAPGYGGTRGEGLLYPWDCSMVRNAMEVIGAYPPPPRPAQPGNTHSPETFLASYGGRTYYMVEDRVPAVSRRASAPYTEESNSVPTAELPAKPVAKSTAKSAGKPLFVPGVAVASAATGNKVDVGNERYVFGWGLFSMMSIAVVVVGVRGLRKRRRAVVEVAVVAPTPDDSSSVTMLRAEDTVAAPDVESPRKPHPAARQAVSKLKRSIMPTSPRGLPLILRRTVPLVLPLLFLGIKLYSASRGQEDARTRITDETRQYMIRNL